MSPEAVDTHAFVERQCDVLRIPLLRGLKRPDRLGDVAYITNEATLSHLESEKDIS